MGTVTKTELNQQTARVLARVAAGEHITVVERGRPIAEISPPRDSPWERLVASGRVRLPTGEGGLAVSPARSAETSAEILADIREERR